MSEEQANEKNKLGFGYPWKSMAIVIVLSILLLVFLHDEHPYMKAQTHWSKKVALTTLWLIANK